MIIVIFFLLLLIGFIFFNPLKVSYDNETGLLKSSIMPFGIYCFILIFCLCFLIPKYNDKILQYEADLKSSQTADNKEKNSFFNIFFTKEPTYSSINFSADLGKTSDAIGYIPLKINEMSEYDGKTKAEIFQMRKEIVDSYRGLGGENYQPSEEILGNIHDEKPWWGTEGVLCNGPGEHSSDGLSVESSYFNNPFILLNVDLNKMMITRNKDCSVLWFLPRKLMVNQEDRFFMVGYDLQNFMKAFKGNDYNNGSEENDWIEIGSINANDFGYKYAKVVTAKNIKFKNGNSAFTDYGVRITNFWGVDESCKIPEGCNNNHLSNDAFSFLVEKYPAKLIFGLYKQELYRRNQKPAAYFGIYLY